MAPPQFDLTKAANMLSTNNPMNKKKPPQSSSADDEHITSRSDSEHVISNLSTTLCKLNELRIGQKFGKSQSRGNALDQRSLQENCSNNSQKTDKAPSSNQSHEAISNLSGTLKKLKKMRIQQEIERSRSSRSDPHQLQDAENPDRQCNDNGRTLGLDHSAVSSVEKKRIISTYDRTMKETENIFEPIVPEKGNNDEEHEIVLGLDGIIGENSLSVERKTVSEDQRRMSLEREAVSEYKRSLSVERETVSEDKRRISIEPPSRHSSSSAQGIFNLSVSDKSVSSANSSKSNAKSGSRSNSFWKRSRSTGSSSRVNEDSKAKTKSENKSQGVKSDSESATNSIRSSIESLKKKVKKTVKSTMCIALPSSAKEDDIRPLRRDVKVSRPMNVNVAQTPDESRAKSRSYFDMAKHFANELGDFENGCYMFEKAMEERKRFSIANTDSYADLLLEYRKLLKKMGNYAKADQVWTQAMEIKTMINSI